MSSMNLHMQSAGVQEYGLWALLNLCHEDHVAESFMKPEIYKLIKDSMESHLLQDYGLCVLLKLADDPDCAAALMQQGGVDKLSMVSMKLHPERPVVQIKGMSTL